MSNWIGASFERRTVTLSGWLSPLELFHAWSPACLSLSNGIVILQERDGTNSLFTAGSNIAGGPSTKLCISTMPKYRSTKTDDRRKKNEASYSALSYRLFLLILPSAIAGIAALVLLNI